MSVRFPRWCLAAAFAVAVSTAPARAADPEDLDALQKKLLQLMLQGNPKPDDLMKMVAEMNKLLLKDFPDLPPIAFPNDLGGLRPQLPALPGFRPQMRLPLPFPQPLGELPGRQPAADPLANDPKLKDFDDAIEKLKDDPAAQAELKKARDEYKKALEEGLKKNGGVARPERPALPDPFVRPRAVPLPVPDLDIVRPARRPSGPARLGVVIEKPSALIAEHLNLPDEVGVVVVEVQPGSPAEKAGLRPNDVVVKLGGQDAPSELTRFQQLVSSLKAGEKVEAVVYRKGKKETVGGIDLSPAR